jgi:uncharacterized protein YqiB (DUF1249 family)
MAVLLSPLVLNARQDTPFLVLIPQSTAMGRFSPLQKPYWLHHVCEHNYLKLTRLIVDWAYLVDTLTAHADSKPPLCLKLLQRSPYTLVIKLTHAFVGDDSPACEPDIRIRICLDAKTAEVLTRMPGQTVSRADSEPFDPEQILEQKWRYNYFLSRWLDHCLSSNYRFSGRV